MTHRTGLVASALVVALAGCSKHGQSGAAPVTKGPVVDGAKLAITWPLSPPCNVLGDVSWAWDNDTGDATSERTLALTKGGQPLVTWDATKRHGKQQLDAPVPFGGADGIDVHLPAGTQSQALRVVLRCSDGSQPKAGEQGVAPRGGSDVHWRCADGRCVTGATYGREQPLKLATRCPWGELDHAPPSELQGRASALVDCGTDVLHDLDVIFKQACGLAERCSATAREAGDTVQRLAGQPLSLGKVGGAGDFTLAASGGELRLACEAVAGAPGCRWRAFVRKDGRSVLRYELATRVVFGVDANGAGEGDGALFPVAPLDLAHFILDGSALSVK